jgi:hypothetical protein
MRKLFVIFLLFINFLFNFAYGQGVDFNANNFNKNQQTISVNYNSNNIISVDFRGYENAILRLNQNTEEISALSSQNNNRANNTEFISHKKYLKTKSYKNNLAIIFDKSHNISTKLKNEICTRAP